MEAMVGGLAAWAATRVEGVARVAVLAGGMVVAMAASAADTVAGSSAGLMAVGAVIVVELVAWPVEAEWQVAGAGTPSSKQTYLTDKTIQHRGTSLGGRCDASPPL